MVTAADFKKTFLDSYNQLELECRTTWKEIWEKQWNGFMLWQRTDAWGAQLLNKQSVLALTAEKLGLRYDNGEPMTLDAVFCARSNPHRWFPIEVAIEHENNARGFETEIEKLLSVRCRLKVGITYTGHNEATAQSGNERIREIIEDRFEISKRQGVEHSTDYLFLVGTDGWQKAECAPPEYVCKWYGLELSGTDGPDAKDFVALT